MKKDLFAVFFALPFSLFMQLSFAQEIEVLPAFATTQLRERIGTVVSVEGVVSRIGVSRDGSALFVNFEGHRRGDLELVRFPEAGEYAEDRVRLEGLVGKKIRVDGNLYEYEGKLQIEIKNWFQIKEL